MSRKVAEILDRGGRRSYQNFLAVKYMLMGETLAEANPADAETSRRLEQLAFLESLNAQELVERATPFFWHNVHRLYRVRGEDAAVRARMADFLVATAFDAFFDRVPDGYAIAIDGKDGIHLPRLRLAVPPSNGKIALRRAGDRVDVTADAPAEVLAHHQVHELPEALLLPNGHPALLTDGDIGKLATKADVIPGLADMIRTSLGIITLADPSRAARLTSLIRYYFPITTPDPATTHNSFSVVQMVGVIFLSEAYSDIRLVEAMVHEYHHNELYAVMEGTKVIDAGLDELYYSPWRPDARPLYGLFHALHVFSGVVDFYLHALSVDALREHHDTFRDRCVHICWQLKTGLAQIRPERLTAVGMEVIESLHEELRSFEKAIGSLPAEMPPSQQKHLVTWRTEHPNLVVA